MKAVNYKVMSKLLFALIVIGLFGLGSSFNIASAAEDYSLCEGSGERCRVSVNGVPVSFVKGKDKSAIVIKL